MIDRTYLHQWHVQQDHTSTHHFKSGATLVVTTHTVETYDLTYSVVRPIQVEVSGTTITGTLPEEVLQDLREWSNQGHTIANIPESFRAILQAEEVGP